VLHGGRQLEEDVVLSEAGVAESATLDVLGRLVGGGKKRKKKTYTKPKKNKHKHKNVKLRVLKFYKVEDSGKVTRTHRVCPGEECGAFMATHHDRVHCGKCNRTYMYAEGAAR
jgi:small subunit ribosomal protein S27Ae